MREIVIVKTVTLYRDTQVRDNEANLWFCAINCANSRVRIHTALGGTEGICSEEQVRRGS